MRWTTSRYWLASVILFATVAPGCVADEVPRGDGWSVCDECEPSPIDVPDEDAPPRLGDLEPCAPQAAPTQPQGIPELPYEVSGDQCPLREQLNDRDADGEAESVTRWRREGDVIEKTVENSGRLWQRVTFAVDEQGALRRVHRHQDHLDAGSGHTEQTWTLDARGRLTSQVYRSWREDDGVEALQHAQELHQTWQDGRLVERTERSRSDGAEQQRRYRWSYDAQGRLSEARVEHAPTGATQRTTWRYEEGRPAGVERIVDGVAVERRSWQYHDNGVVASHDVAFGLRGLDERAAASNQRIARLVDTYHTPDPYVLYSPYAVPQDPWPAANPAVDARRECYSLPSALGHGYPTDEPAYQVGWERVGARPLVDFVMGYGGHGYAYGYGEHAWYGHAGLGTPWPAGQLEVYGVVAAQVQYDRAGRMIDETLSLTPYADAADHPSELEVLQVARQRQFGERGLLEDRISVQAGEATRTRRLLFEHDARGQLLRRELWQEDQQLASQSWEYDAQGHVIAHEVHRTTSPREMLLSLADLSDGPFDALVHTASYERRFDADGRLEVVEAEGFGDVSQRSELRRTYGAHGPLEEYRRYEFADSASASRSVYDYDAQGRQTTALHDNDDDGVVDQRVEHVYEDDLLVEVRSSYGHRTQVDSMVYACE